jgi:hypothetical protein
MVIIFHSYVKLPEGIITVIPYPISETKMLGVSPMIWWIIPDRMMKGSATAWWCPKWGTPIVIPFFAGFATLKPSILGIPPFSESSISLHIYEILEIR